MRKPGLLLILAIYGLLFTHPALFTSHPHQAINKNPITEETQLNMKLLELDRRTFDDNPVSSVAHRPPIYNPPGWNTYSNRWFGVQFKFPPEGELKVSLNQNVLEVRVELPFTSGTLLTEKYLVFQASQRFACFDFLSSKDVMGNERQFIEVNGTKLEKEVLTEGAAGSVYSSINDSTRADRFYYSLSFVLRSSNPEVYPENPPPDFDRQQETKVFSKILSTLIIKHGLPGVI